MNAPYLFIKKHWLRINLIALSLICFPYFGNSQLIELKANFYNPGNLNAYYHLSKSHEQTQLPLLVVLHGCNQNAKALDKISELSRMSDLHGFHLLYPEQKIQNNLSRCFNWFLHEDTDTLSGESASIKHLVDYFSKHFPIRANSIFICGLSAGAEMSIVQAVNQPYLYKGVAEFAGGPYFGKLSMFDALKYLSHPPDEFDFKQPVQHLKNVNSISQLIIVHGKKDKVVAFKNSEILFEQWKYLLKEKYSSEYDTMRIKKNVVVRIAIHENIKNKIVYYSLSKIGHALPIDPGTGINQGGKKGAFTNSCGFYSIYFVLKDFGLISPIK